MATTKFTPSQKQKIANAKLISAAPELYDALEKLLMEIGMACAGCCCILPDNEACVKARAALKKARGE
jgi:hypothetical protein